jgi:hypothetical protein
MESQYKKQPCVNLVHNAKQGFGYQMEKNLVAAGERRSPVTLSMVTDDPQV